MAAHPLWAAPMPILKVNDLHTSFRTRHGVHRAVGGVSFTLQKGEVLGLVGESGSGKSVTCASILGLLPQPSGTVDRGEVVFDDINLLQCTPERRRTILGRRIGTVFQDPMTGLNPYLRISEQLIEPLLIHAKIPRVEALARGLTMLEAVGVNDAPRRLHQYPHEFSGGMRQRVLIAMALITKPEILIADEPTTALDVTVQAQILDLLRRLTKETGLSVIFITHDLGVVARLCDRVLVMYAGRIVEQADTRTLFRDPKHPYTQALLGSIPSRQPKGRPLATIPGMPPDLSLPISGCPFAARCPHVLPSCLHNTAVLTAISDQHAHACTRYFAEASKP